MSGRRIEPVAWLQKMTRDSGWPPSIDPSILGEAADWLMKIQSGDATEEVRRALDRWCRQTPDHAAAWQRAESVLATFGQVPSNIGRDTLGRLGKTDRRYLLRALGAVIVMPPAVWLAWHQLPVGEWTADVRTAVGEQRTITLDDGTLLVLNTATAVDIAFDANQRIVKLVAGEILVVTGRDQAPVHRPFIVRTPEGAARALGTRFTVRRHKTSTQLAVFEGSVEIQPIDAASATIVDAGAETEYESSGAQGVRPTDPSRALWTQGMLVAKNMRLAEFAAELGRYRQGILRCHPDVADMRVTGAFPINDTDASLRLLEKTRPLRISSMTHYWVTIGPR